MKPKAFIGSSVEGLKIAYAIQENLEHDAEVTVWSQGVFQPSGYTLDSLTTTLNNSDYGIWVFSPDDVVTIRDSTQQAVRDNVIFELGLFIGRLGRERNFIVMPRGVDRLHIPTDLLGITPGAFEAKRQDGNLVAALGPACSRMREVIKKHGPFPGRGAQPSALTTEPEKTQRVFTPTEEEVTILLKVSESQSGTLLYVKYDGGLQLMVEAEQLVTVDGAKERMRWQEAFGRLLQVGLLSDIDRNGEVYHLSTQGHEAAAQIRAQRLEKAKESVEFRGVLWKKEIDGTYLPCCPTCKTALAKMPPWGPDFLDCRKCKFKAPFHPDELPDIVKLLPS